MNELPRPLAVSSMSWKMEGLRARLFWLARWTALTPLLLGPPGFALLSALSGSRGRFRRWPRPWCCRSARPRWWG